MELEVGISERITVGERFDSVLKLLFQDFHVQEIDETGTVLELDELILRADISEELKDRNKAEDDGYSQVGPGFAFTDNQVSQMSDLIGEEDFIVLKEFLSQSISESHPYCVLRSPKLNGVKENRKKFHSFVREEFGTFLVTDTFEEGPDNRSFRVWIKRLQMKEQQKYKAEFFNARENGGRAKKFKPNTQGLSVGVMMKDPWPVDRPNYLHFRMYKENRDTAEAIQSIARALAIPPKSFQFAGTKDRRGITVQGVSVYRVSVESLRKALLHSSWDKAVRISHLEYKTEPLRVGGSNGNRFKICLRHVSLSNEEIDSLFSQLARNGFLNYYGLQRFGNRSVRTHHVGGRLVGGDWKGAVDLLLGGDGGNTDNEDQRNAWRSLYVAGDMEAAYNACPSFLYIEKALLRSLHLSGQSTNYLNAIQSLPSTTTSMYLHSVQSLMFNAALTHRIKTFGAKVLVGDLVLVSSSDVQKIETEEQAAQFSIKDVVQTLVGSCVEIPPNMTEFYADFFESQFQASPNVNFHLPKFLQLKGAYRRMLAPAEDVQWSIHENVSDATVLISSDVDRLAGRIPQIPESCAGDNKTGKAVVFQCSLQSGCYLTMALREISRTTEQELKPTDNSSPK